MTTNFDRLYIRWIIFSLELQSQQREKAIHASISLIMQIINNALFNLDVERRSALRVVFLLDLLTASFCCGTSKLVPFFAQCRSTLRRFTAVSSHQMIATSPVEVSIARLSYGWGKREKKLLLELWISVQRNLFFLHRHHRQKQIVRQLLQHERQCAMERTSRKMRTRGRTTTRIVWRCAHLLPR